MKEIKSTDGRKLVGLAKALDRDLIVFDLEHTSGSYDSCGILEFAGLHIRPNGYITKLESLFNPETKIPAFISKLTGIYPAMVKAKPKWATNGAPYVIENQEAVWIGFNSRASDVKRIQALHRRQNLDVPAFPYQIDLLRLGKRMGCAGSLSELTRLHAPHAVEEDAHRAYADVKMTAALLESWLDYALDNLDSLMESTEQIKESHPMKPQPAKQIAPSKPSASTNLKHGKKWNDEDIGIVRHAVETQHVDVVKLSQQLGRSMFAIALKSVSMGFRDERWAEGIKLAQIEAAQL